MIETVQDFLRKIASDDDDDRQDARFCELRDEDWMEYIERPDSEKRTVLLNKRLGRAVLQLLAEDADPDVRAWVAMRRSVGADDILAHALATDPDSSVRCVMARNPKADVELLRTMAQHDPDEYARGQALEALAERSR